MNIKTSNHWDKVIFVPFACNYNKTLRVARIILLNFEVVIQW